MTSFSSCAHSNVITIVVITVTKMCLCMDTNPRMKHAFLVDSALLGYVGATVIVRRFLPVEKQEIYECDYKFHLIVYAS